MQRFVVEGCVAIRTSHPAAYHEDICEQVAALHALPGPDAGSLSDALGDDIVPAMPDLTALLQCPRVHLLLQRLLGPGYALDPHRYCHVALGGRNAQELHIDSMQSTGAKVARGYHPHWILAMYYPGAVTSEMGPTAIVKGSQYLW